MDFSLKSFSDAFRDTRYRINNRDVLVFAFILATPADRNLFPDLLVHFYELHRLTGDHIFVVAPQIQMYKAPNVPMSASEISNVLSNKKFYNHYSRENVDVSRQVENFLKDQIDETYKFANFIGLDVNKIPSIVFFDSLESPARYICWSLQGTSASNVIKDFRTIVDNIKNAKSKEDMPNALDVIHNLDRRRFALRVLKEFGKVIPLLTNFMGKG